MDTVELLLALSTAMVLIVSLVSNLTVLCCYGASSELRKRAPGVFILNLTCSNLLLTLLNMPLTLAGVVRSGHTGTPAAPFTASNSNDPRQQNQHQVFAKDEHASLSSSSSSSSSSSLSSSSSSSSSRPCGESLCQAAAFAETFLTTNAMLSVVALGLDRWVAVLFPLSYAAHMRRRDAALVLAYAWLHSLAFPAAALAHSPSWLAYGPSYASCTLVQGPPLSPPPPPPPLAPGGPLGSAGSASAHRGSSASFAAFSLAYHALTFFLSLLVLCLTYLKVLRVARSHCQRIDVVTMHALILLVDIHPSVRARCLEEQKARRTRAPRRVSTFIGTFVLCFAPYVITRLVELSPAVPLIDRRWGLFARCLAYSKAALDPFVYALLRRQCRRVLAEMFHLRRHHSHHHNHNHHHHHGSHRNRRHRHHRFCGSRSTGPRSTLALASDASESVVFTERHSPVGREDPCDMSRPMEEMELEVEVSEVTASSRVRIGDENDYDDDDDDYDGGGGGQQKEKKEVRGEAERGDGGEVGGAALGPHHVGASLRATHPERALVEEVGLLKPTDRFSGDFSSSSSSSSSSPSSSTSSSSSPPQRADRKVAGRRGVSLPLSTVMEECPGSCPGSCPVAPFSTLNPCPSGENATSPLARANPSRTTV